MHAKTVQSVSQIEFGTEYRSLFHVCNVAGQSAEDDVKKLADINSQLSKLGIGQGSSSDL